MGGKGSGLVSAYKPEDVDYALAVLVLHGGRPTAASRALAEEGRDISPSLLSNWKTHPDGRYERVVAAVMPRVDGKVAGLLGEVLIKSTELESEMVDHLQSVYKNLDPKDVASALRNVATVKGINADKLNVLTGRPTHIVEQRDASQIIRSILQKVQPGVVDSTAEEIGVSNE
jgi:hypothetical protein